MINIATNRIDRTIIDKYIEGNVYFPVKDDFTKHVKIIEGEILFTYYPFEKFRLKISSQVSKTRVVYIYEIM